MPEEESSLPDRRSIRLPEYDYAQAGAHFVSVCSAARECMFGHIADDKMVPNGLGRIVEDEWLKTQSLRPGIVIDVYVVMPNHFHVILWIMDVASGTARRAPTVERFAAPTVRSLPTIIRAFKSSATRRINQLRGTPGAATWQRGFYEHVIRSEKELGAKREYILNNPLQWALDEDNPAHFP